MIPRLRKDGQFPEDIHKASLAELKTRFATNPWREALFEGLKRGLRNLKQAGVHTVYIDGCYLTEKIHPMDIDSCWDASPEIDMNV